MGQVWTLHGRARARRFVDRALREYCGTSRLPFQPTFELTAPFSPQVSPRALLGVRIERDRSVWGVRSVDLAEQKDGTYLTSLQIEQIR